MFRPLLAAVLLVAPAVAFAHHGWSSYDEAKPVTASGPLTDVTWGNPHGTAKMTVKGKTWDLVLAPTSRMEARGLKRAAIDKGQTVTVTGYPRRDGTDEMRIERVSVGKTVVELR